MWDFEHFENALFWIIRGKSLPDRQTRFLTSATTSFQQEMAFNSVGRAEYFWAMKEAKQNAVIKASWPARCPLKRSWREALSLLADPLAWKEISTSALLFSSFLFRFLLFFWSSRTTARKTSWDFLQVDDALFWQKPWF